MPSTNPSYAEAESVFAEMRVDTETAMKKLSSLSVSIHCWQGDDVSGFESPGQALGAGLAVTGNYPGKARNADELRADFEKALSCIPGRHRFNLHASYAETNGKRVDRNQLESAHFSAWMDWASDKGLGLDFNPTFFSHPKADSGWTLAHKDKGIRSFWMEHGIACREIASAMGRRLNSPCVNNVWIPDGFKDTPADRSSPRERLKDSLDQIFRKKMDSSAMLDSVESKLFGIGSESYVAGSHEFYLGYAVQNQMILCIDTGHFHPTEAVSDKISSVLLWVPEILLHVSRGIRWDSDHVVVMSDDLQALARELARGGFWDRTRMGLDFFDASINRIAAWIIGARAWLKAVLIALLEPVEILRQFENEGDYTSRLAWMESLNTLPYGAVWNEYCRRMNVPKDPHWLKDVKRYEAEVLQNRQGP